MQRSVRLANPKRYLPCCASAANGIAAILQIKTAVLCEGLQPPRLEGKIHKINGNNGLNCLIQSVLSKLYVQGSNPFTPSCSNYHRMNSLY